MSTISSILVRIDSNISNKRIAGKVLGAVLKKQYPEQEHSITSAEIFNWPLWSVYLKIHCSLSYGCTRFHTEHIHHQLASCNEPDYLKWTVPFSDEDKLTMTCSHAVAVLEEVYNDIVSGAITIKQLCEMEEHKLKLFEFCKAARGKNIQYLAQHRVSNALEKYKVEYYRLTSKITRLRTPLLKVFSQVRVEGKLLT